MIAVCIHRYTMVNDNRFLITYEENVKLMYSVCICRNTWAWQWVGRNTKDRSWWGPDPGNTNPRGQQAQVQVGRDAYGWCHALNDTRSHDSQ